MNELTFLWWVTMLWVGSSRTSYLRRRRRSLFECVLFECVYKHSMTSMLNWIPSTFCHTLFCLSVHSKTIISINSNYCFEFCWEVSLSGSSFFRVALAGAKRRLVAVIGEQNNNKNKSCNVIICISIYLFGSMVVMKIAEKWIREEQPMPSVHMSDWLLAATCTSKHRLM